MNWNTVSTWEAVHGTAHLQRTTTDEIISNILRDHYNSTSGKKWVDAVPYKAAHYRLKSRFDLQTFTAPHNRIMSGCAVSALVRHQQDMNTAVVPVSELSTGKLAYFAVAGVYFVDSTDIWCAAMPLITAVKGYRTGTEEPVPLLINERVRRVALVHIGDEMCSVNG